MLRKLIISGDIYEYYEYEKVIQKSKRGIRSSRGFFAGINLVSNPRRIDNLRAAKRLFVRRVLSHIKDFGSPLLVTCTLGPDVEQVGQWELVRLSFRNFVLRLREADYEVSYVSVPEFQRRGVLHLHILVWGLPASLGDVRQRLQGEKIKTTSVGSERVHRYLASCWGRGYVDARCTDGSPKLVSYLGKYLTKSWSDKRFAGYRLVNYSHGFSYPQKLELADDVDFDKDIVPVIGLKLVDEFIINTHWWGKITKRKYEFRSRSDNV